MRMNPSRGESAAALLRRISITKLADLLKEHSDEPQATSLASAILNAQSRQPLSTTRELAAVVRDTFARLPQTSDEGSGDAVRRVFQALRIAVNDEFGVLDMLLRTLPSCLKPGGRVAILTFHSGEDRRVKLAFKQGLSDGLYSSIADDVIRASPEEKRANPRSSSAKLRYAIRSREAG
jgi:16S rRNA (cytosine1402-N4)-methyltransferase